EAALRRRGRSEATPQGRGDGRTRPRNRWEDGERLAEPDTDGCCSRGKLPVTARPSGRPEDHAGDDELDAEPGQRMEALLDLAVKQHPDHARGDRGDDEQSRVAHARALAAQQAATDAPEPGAVP